MILRKTAMFRAVIGALATIASAAALAAPTVQTCAPMEILHGDGAGLSYQLSCEAGPWKMRYSGIVPAGDDAVNAQYRLAVTGPQGVSFVQTRVARLPAPAKLGQTLVREAVLLDNGDLALRDCKEANCTRYRPMSVMTDEKATVNTAAASVTVTPEIKRLHDEQRQLTRDINDMQAKFNAERASLEAQAAAKLKAEQDAANTRLSQVLERLSVLEAENKRLAGDKVAADKRQTACDEQSNQLASANARVAALDADLARLTAAQYESKSRLSVEQGSVSKLNAEVNALKRDLAAARAAEAGSSKKAESSVAKIAQLEQELTLRTAELANARAAAEKTAAELKAKAKMAPAEKAAYDFALATVVAQHNEQVAAVHQALPKANLTGILDEMKVPRIANEPVSVEPVKVEAKVAEPKVEAPVVTKQAPTSAKDKCRGAKNMKRCIDTMEARAAAAVESQTAAEPTTAAPAVEKTEAPAPVVEKAPEPVQAATEVVSAKDAAPAVAPVASTLTRKEAIREAKEYCRKSSRFKACVHEEVNKRMAAASKPAAPAQDQAPALQLDTRTEAVTEPAPVATAPADVKEQEAGFLSRMFKSGK